MFFEKDGDRHPIDLSEDIRNQRSFMFSICKLLKLIASENDLTPCTLAELDPGETESLAFLIQSTESYVISSGDAIVYRVLGLLNRGEQGLSLEEILDSIGLRRSKLPWSCQKAFREKYTKEGEVTFGARQRLEALEVTYAPARPRPVDYHRVHLTAESGR